MSIDEEKCLTPHHRSKVLNLPGHYKALSIAGPDIQRRIEVHAFGLPRTFPHSNSLSPTVVIAETK